MKPIIRDRRLTAEEAAKYRPRSASRLAANDLTAIARHNQRAESFAMLEMTAAGTGATPPRKPD